MSEYQYYEFVAIDRPPPWITLRHTSPTATVDWRVVQ